MENEAGSSSMYSELKAAGIKYQDNMVNYAQLDDLYVGLIQAHLAPQQHQLTANNDGMSPKAIALAVGDTVLIHNNTQQAQNFFVAETVAETGKVQAFPSLAAGAKASYKIDLEGDLALLSEDNGILKTAVLAQKNMQALRVSSGGSYQFSNLNPGTYPLIFWYWRLGKIQQAIQIQADENLRVDKTLTVDSVIKAH
jgi:hypothetical protein